jgi:hypothetical protein
MYHFETTDNKNKKIILEHNDVKELLKLILSHDNKNGLKNDDELSVIFEDSVSNILLDIPEKYLKHIFEIAKIRKTPKLEKAVKDFNSLNLKLINSINFKNKCHEGIITIWDEEVIEATENTSDDEDDSVLESDNENDNDQLSDSGNEGFIADDCSESSLESIHMNIYPINLQNENKKLREENKKLKEQIQLLKSFVVTYRDMCLKLSDESKNLIR